MAARQAVADIVLICAIDHTWESGLASISQARHGPIAVRFERTCYVFEQPLGREEIAVNERTESQWAEIHQDPDYEYVTFSLYELACYRRSYFDDHPKIDRVTGYRSDDRTGFSGLVLQLSSGGIVGFDASSDQGLRLFLDGQQKLFEKEYVRACRLLPIEVWKREI